MSVRKQTMFRAMLPNGGGSGPLPPQGLSLDIFTSGTNSTDTSSNTVSNYNQYFRYSCMHMFISDTELNAANSGSKTLTGIQVEGASSTSTDSCPDMRIYVAHTNEVFLSTLMETDISQSSSFSYFDRAQVYDGTEFLDSGWNTIDFDTNFVYDGTSNVVITMEKRYGFYDVGGSRWKALYGSRFNSFRSAVYNSDSTASSNFPQSSSAMTTLGGNTQNTINLKINY